MCILQCGVDGMNPKSVHFSINENRGGGGGGGEIEYNYFFTNIWSFKLPDVLEDMQYQVK